MAKATYKRKCLICALLMQRNIVHDNHVREHISKKPLRPYILVHNWKAERAHTGNGMRIFETSKVVSIDRQGYISKTLLNSPTLGDQVSNILPMVVIVIQATTNQLRNWETVFKRRIYVSGQKLFLVLVCRRKEFS